MKLPAGDVLLTRDLFREAVFMRDQKRCVVCAKPAQDAHHIMERRLFPDGGYRLDNGASLCSSCHEKAEQTLITPEEIRAGAKIERVLLPPQLEVGESYDKWGNTVRADGVRYPGEMFFEEQVQKVLKEANLLPLFQLRFKYPRTPHLPWSPGATEDDIVLGKISGLEGHEVVVTEKLDGESTTLALGYMHARSPDSKHHPSRDWVKALWGQIRWEIPEGWRVCGENMYARHSIGYERLPSYFLCYAIIDERNRCLSWDETVEWCQLWGIETVPVLYRGPYDEAAIKAAFDGRSRFGEVGEGYVVRRADDFRFSEFGQSVAKWVRQGHVQTDEHWMHSEIVPNQLRGKEREGEALR